MKKIYKNLSLDLNDLDVEIWKFIKNFECYQISNYGRIKSFKRYGGTDVRILEQSKDNDGYFIVGLHKNGKRQNKKVHKLMYTHFIGLIPKGFVIHHLDFTTNNFLENFQVMTRSEHQKLHNPKGEKNPNYGKHLSEKTKKLMSETWKEKSKNGELNNKGEDNGRAILKEQDVTQIRKLSGEGLTNVEIAKMFGVNQQTISKIKNRKLWKHIK